MAEEIWFESGDGDSAAESPGYFDFVRKFSQETEYEVCWDEMITASFTCDPGVRLGLKGSIHADMDDVPGWFRKVEASRSFRAGVGFAGWSFEVRVDGA